MKSLITALFALLVVASAAQADWRWKKERFHGAKNPAYTNETITRPSYCYDTGWEISFFGAGIFPEDIDNDGIGGGVSLGYYFGPNWGFDLSYAAFGSTTAQQAGSGHLIYRIPFESRFCSAWAPYFFGGIGGLSDGPTEFFFDAGAGLDFRFESWGCTAFFAEYNYAFTDDNVQDFSMVKLGVRLPF